jgi:hypothetical protein
VKTGLILYITGDDRRCPTDKTVLLRQMPGWVDRVEVVSKHNGFFEISDAWWALTARGMHRIICRIGEIGPSGNIRMTGRELRLHG